MSESNTHAPAHGAQAAAPLASTQSQPSASDGFAALGLIEPLVRACVESGYETPTPIQVKAIPVVLEGRDVLAGAQTGTGKTAAFTLPILQMLAAKPRKPASKHARVLVLSPTRELSAQIEESVRTYGKHMRVSSTLVYGGVGMQPQIDALARGVDILVATPGRLLDHAGEKTVDLSTIEILVLDEADRMLDMGFIRDIRKVLALLPKKRQNLLFSATFSDEIRQLASGLLHDPAEVSVARRNAEAESVAQCCYLVPKERKRDLLVHLVKTGDWQQVLVFTKTKHGANRLAEQLRRADIEADAIHGNKSQGARTRALGGFKAGEVRVLVATDIAARGLDIEGLPHVVNFDLPNVSEDYVHRIGRTGRAGMEGDAVSLVSPEDESLLAAIERLMKKKVRREPLPQFAAAPQAAKDPRAEEQAQRQQAPREKQPSAGRSGGDGSRGRSQPRRQEAGRGGDRRAQPAAGQRRDGQARPAQARDGQRSGDGQRNGGGRGEGRNGRDGRGGRGDGNRQHTQGHTQGNRPPRPEGQRRPPQPVASQARVDTNAAAVKPVAEESAKPQEKRPGTFASLLSAFLPTRS